MDKDTSIILEAKLKSSEKEISLLNERINNLLRIIKQKDEDISSLIYILREK
jgi:CII-binding regulator of phage lambda lysogenization HflD